ncbi:hypothetical protein TTY48_07120 [Tsukamurella sp. TY48]|nr:hypothetical protein TTY48_07120 [Tsukamurella sp. TY48]
MSPNGRLGGTIVSKGFGAAKWATPIPASESAIARAALSVVRAGRSAVDTIVRLWQIPRRFRQRAKPDV